jgi:hypothetical protein
VTTFAGKVAGAGVTPAGRLLREGEGWRYGHDPDRGHHCVLIAGEHWATELTVTEAQGLRRLVGRLLAQHGELAGQLMAEESITISGEEGDWWVELEGDRQAWSLRFVLTGNGRGVEGSWPAPAAMAMVQALLNGGGW